ncbi:uncharacterized protein LOC129739664 [Uranotaenia lowii]|uniref:uncharacterized protein LOC129739664 n=1 Tax=Uranotaenia lowii TaxID=190385 RepID=UPI00247AD22B|nr:uncharacterized protein LOC129739664 [Uranotaenia lowii]
MLIRFSGSASKTWERVTSIFSDYLWKFVHRPAAIEMPRSKRRHHSRSRSRSSGGYREKRPKRTYGGADSGNESAGPATIPSSAAAAAASSNTSGRPISGAGSRRSNVRSAQLRGVFHVILQISFRKSRT